MSTPHLYSIKDSASINEYSVVGLIDSSEQMTKVWQDICKAWNYFIGGYKNVKCIQFDEESTLQEQPQLKDQHGKGKEVDIGSAFKTLNQLIDNEMLLQNTLIIFVTAGIGINDSIKEYIEEVQQQFEKLHSSGFQVKLHIIAVGDQFSHQICSELKKNIHNSTLLCSELDHIENPQIDFTKILQEIKDETMSQLIRVDPSCQLTTFTNSINRVAPNQVIYTTHPTIRVSGKQINLEKENITAELLDKFIRQIMAKLLQYNLAGIEVKQEAITALQIIEKFKESIIFKDDDELKSFIDQNIQKIEEFATGNLQLSQFSPKKAITFIHDVQDLIIRNRKRMQRIKRKSHVQAQLTMHPKQPKPQKDYYKELAIKRLDQYEKQLNNEELFSDLKEFARQNMLKTLDQILYLTKTHDFQLKNIKEFIQKDEDTAIDIIDLVLITLYD